MYMYRFNDKFHPNNMYKEQYVKFQTNLLLGKTKNFSIFTK